MLKTTTSFCAASAIRWMQPSGLALPILVSIPHAGRMIPRAVLDAARVPAELLSRFSAPLVERGASFVAARYARVVADCNRDEGDMDPADVAPSVRSWFGPPGQKARAGLGVIPSRLAGAGQIWRTPLDAAAMTARFDNFHRPYHARLARLIERLRAEFGAVLLIDVHSMPSLALRPGQALPPQIVIGDRFGKSIAPGLAARFADIAPPRAIRCALNIPYAGGHIIERHAQPRAGVHALQIEFDRALYLDADGLPDASAAMELGEWLADAAMACAAGLADAGPEQLAAE
jgi:N-formylglutamate amidohydrolase